MPRPGKLWGLLTTTLVLGILGPRALAQPPSGPADGKRYSNKSVLRLPVKIEERTRVTLQEIGLYVKATSAGWIRHEIGSPAQKEFNFKVPQDGEYWFALVTVDKMGRLNQDLNQLVPALKVIVDTQAPILDVQPAMSQEGDAYLRCTMKDAHADLASIRVVYRSEGAEKVLEPVPQHPGVFRISGPEMLSQIVRVVGTDLCGNTASHDISAKDLAAVLFPNRPTGIAGGLNNRSETVNGGIEPPMDLPANRTQIEPQGQPPLAVGELPAPSFPPTHPGSSSTPGQVTSGNKVDPEVNAKTSSPGDVMLINKLKAAVDYRIDQVGPSGVSKVEVWLTTDKGNTWQRIGEDLDRRSPAEIDLPGEGLFGIRLALTNGNGFGGTPPARGDAPHCWIEADITSPFVQLKPIDPVTSGGALDIRWTANDKNLKAEPVNLYFRTKNDGPWQPIARGLKNDGHYRWVFPHEVGGQFWVRLEVADQASNVAVAETPNPIVLDMTEPRAVVVGVTGMAPRP